MPPPTLVFDLDGTLVDTAPDLIDALNVVFAREGLPPLPYANARMLIGGGVRTMISRGLAAEDREAPHEYLDRLLAEFITHYTAHIADSSRLFPGVEPALDELAADGFSLAVCTNKLEALSVQLLKTLGLADRFSAICGPDTFGVQKPDPVILHRTISAAGGKAATAIMIGDSATDVLTARAAGVPVIAVDFGYTERPIAEFHPDRIIGHFNELALAIAPFAARR